MSSYDHIVKWAKEAKAFLKQGEVRSAEINLSMIIAQANEEIVREKQRAKTQEGKK